MIKLSLATIALLLMLTVGCAYDRDRDNQDRSRYQRTETNRTQEGNADGTPMKPGEHASQQTHTVETHRESTATTRD